MCLCVCVYLCCIYASTLVFFFSDPGSVITCSCNQDHAACTNNTCQTELSCQRSVVFDLHNNFTQKDDQYCADPDPTQQIGDNAVHCSSTPSDISNNGTVHFMLCCRTANYCNSDIAAVYDYLEKHKLKIGACIMMCLHVYMYVCGCDKFVGI